MLETKRAVKSCKSGWKAASDG